MKSIKWYHDDPRPKRFFIEHIMFCNGLKSKISYFKEIETWILCLSVSASLLGESRKSGLNLHWPENIYVAAFCIEMTLKITECGLLWDINVFRLYNFPEIKSL